MNEASGSREDRRRRYREVLRLWAAENPTKTIKLQFLLLTNALLVPAFFFVSRELGAGRAAVVGLVALGSDLVWVFSIGRTVIYQKLFRNELERMRAEDPADPFLAIHAPPRGTLPWWGRVSASRYLVGAPLGLCLLWVGLLIWIYARAE